MFGGVYLKFGLATEFMWTQQLSLFYIKNYPSGLEFFSQLKGGKRTNLERINNVPGE